MAQILFPGTKIVKREGQCRMVFAIRSKLALRVEPSSVYQLSAISINPDGGTDNSNLLAGCHL